MPYIPIVGPVIALVAWTVIMMIWMFISRFGAMRGAGLSLKGRVGLRGNALDGVVEDRAQWKSHNYNHLMEQPTIFYAVASASLCSAAATSGSTCCSPGSMSASGCCTA